MRFDRRDERAKRGVQPPMGLLLVGLHQAAETDRIGMQDRREFARGQAIHSGLRFGDGHS